MATNSNCLWKMWHGQEGQERIFNINHQGNTKISVIPLHSLKWLKLKWLAATSVRKRGATGTHLQQVEIWNDANTLYNSLQILKRLKYTGTIQPSHSTPVFNPRVTKRCLYRFVHDCS